MTRWIIVAFCVISLSGCSLTGKPEVGDMKVAASLDINPGNLTVTEDGRIFATVHQFRRQPVQLIEVLPPKKYRAWPDERWNGEFGRDDGFNSLLGLQTDNQGRLWVIDNGYGEPPQSPKLLAFNIDSGELVYRYDFPEDVGPKGSFLQDLAVDAESGFVYLADPGMEHDPAIVVVDINNNRSRRIEGHFSFKPENVDLVVMSRLVLLKDKKGNLKPARVGINPIVLSDDNSKLYYGAMNGETWYYIETELLKSWAPDEEIFRMIFIGGEKPVSDGASADAEGNFFFTDLNNNAITRLDVLGDLEFVVKNRKLSWPDALSFGPDGWLYIAVNQLHDAPIFHNGEDRGDPPYLILKAWTGTEGITGR